MFLALIAFTAQAQFPGGSANEFAAHLAASTKQNVVFANSTEAAIARVDYDAANFNEMARTIRARTGAQILPGADLILTDGLIVPTRVCDGTDPGPQPEWISLSDTHLKDGKVTLATKGKQRLDPLTLEETRFTKPVKVHWFYERTPVSAWVKDMPEEEFLKFVAKAVGARLTLGAKENRLDFDPDTVRMRTTKLLSNWIASGEFKVQWQETEEIDRVGWPKPEERIEMMRMVLEDAPAATISSAFATPESEAPISLKPNSKAVSTFLKSRMERFLKRDESDDAVFPTPLGPLRAANFVDGTLRYQAQLKSDFTLKMTVLGPKNPNTPEFKLEISYARIHKDL